MRISDWSSDVCSSDLNMIRNSYFVKQWKRKCLERDNFICQKCGDIENLKVHHIIYFSKIMENISSYEEDEQNNLMRLEERREGKDCVSKCRSRWSHDL